MKRNSFSSTSKSFLRFCAWGVVGFLVTFSAAQAQISVVVSTTSSHTANQAQVRDFFSGTQLNWADGSKVEVVDQPNTAIEDPFYQSLLGRPSARVRVQWTKLVLSGQAQAPVKASSDAEVKRALSANPNAIGFIDSSALDGSVRELFRVE